MKSYLGVPMSSAHLIHLRPPPRTERLSDPPPAVALSRRELLQSVALLALSAQGCAPLTQTLRMAVVASEGLGAAALSRVLQGLIQAVLAYDHPAFESGTQAAVQAQLLSYFPIDRDPELAQLATALAVFDRTDLFPTLPPPMRAAERRLLLTEGTPVAEIDAALAGREAADRRAYDVLRGGGLPQHFADARVAQARAYLSLWGRSQFLMRRRIYQAVRSMVLIAAYSLPAHWPAIGYAGPIVGLSGIRGS